MPELTVNEMKAIHKSRLFAGLDGAGIENALSFFQASVKAYRRGEIIHNAGSVLKCFGMVLSGSVQVYEDDINGERMIMATVTPGETFGEAMCFLKTEEQPVDIAAVSDCKILWLHTEKLDNLNSEHKIEDVVWAKRFTAALAQRMLEMNERIQALSKLTLREKLITFFSQCAHKYAGNHFLLPMNRQDMASYLGTNRSALSRELSKMRGEGLIIFSGNEFILINNTDTR